MSRQGIDDIDVTKLPAPTGISRGNPQPYEITVSPCEDTARDYPLPSLPFLHKGDGLTVPDGETYWIESAKQVPADLNGRDAWTWVYRAVRDTSNDPVRDGWGDEPFGGRPL